MNEASKLSVSCSSMTCLNALGMLSEKRVCTNQTWRGKPTHCTYVWRQRSERSLPSTLYITCTEAGRLMDTATSQQNITDSIRLEKASESIESNITVSITECHLQPFPPWAVCPVSNCPFYKEILPNTQTKPPLAQLETLSSCPVKTQFFPFGASKVPQRPVNRPVSGGAASA